MAAIFTSLAANAQPSPLPPATVLSVDGLERRFHLVVPPRHTPSDRMALVIDLHGTGGTPEKHAWAAHNDCGEIESTEDVALDAIVYRAKKTLMSVSDRATALYRAAH